VARLWRRWRRWRSCWCNQTLNSICPRRSSRHCPHDCLVARSLENIAVLGQECQENRSIISDGECPVKDEKCATLSLCTDGNGSVQSRDKGGAAGRQRMWEDTCINAGGQLSRLFCTCTFNTSTLSSSLSLSLSPSLPLSLSELSLSLSLSSIITVITVLPSSFALRIITLR